MREEVVLGLIVAVPVLLFVLAFGAWAFGTDKNGRWPWNEERRLDEELRRARARVEFSEEGVRLRKREEAARKELEEMKRGGGDG